MALTRFHCELAWTGTGPATSDVLLEVSGDRITSVAPSTKAPPGAVRLPGLTIPGLANVHSHAFHRALRGRSQRGTGDFWTWREMMYEVAGSLDPDTYLALATATYGEMAAAGITAVGEFHYLHHDSRGRRYSDPNEMGHVLVAAAREAGIRITLLDACYLHAGFGTPVEGVQVRFSDGDAEAWAARAKDLGAYYAGLPDVRIGAAIHSVRAVDKASMRIVRGWAAGAGAPLHMHLSEQPAENEACLAATRRTPTTLAADAGVLGPTTTAVHATHLDAEAISRLGGSGTAICMCPTTERDLADGVGNAAALTAAGSPLCLGSDSHAVIDLFEEARAVELDERLTTGRRGRHTADDLLHAATAAGMDALGWPSAGLRTGGLADFVTLRCDTVRLAGLEAADASAHAVFAATAADVANVVVGGQTVVKDGRHVRLDVPRALQAAIGNLQGVRGIDESVVNGAATGSE